MIHRRSIVSRWLVLAMALALATEAAAGEEKPKVEPPSIIVTPVPAPAEKPKATDNGPEAPDQLQATFNDDSAMKLKVLDETVELVTPYGKLTIPVAHIRLIELATRITDEEKRQIALAIGNLSHADYEKREASAALLEDMGEKAFAALSDATKSEEPETARRAKLLIDKLRQEIGEERLGVADHDVIETNESRIAGKITATALKVSTTQFGVLQLKLADVREIRSGAVVEKEPKDVLPDPGNMSNYGNQIGKTLHFRVTGAAQQVGSLYGTGTYTTDSYLAVSAVHAGALKTGETKVVTVKIVGQFQNFVGSTQNGFTSSAYPSYSAYEVVVPKKRRGK